MIRDVMLALTDTASDEPAFDAAIALATSLGARLRVVVPLDGPLAAPAAYGVSPIVLEEATRAMREDADVRAERFRGRLKPHALSSEVHVAEARIAGVRHLLASEARYADLVVVASPGPTTADSAMLHDAFAALLFESGRPVLAVPRDGTVHFPVRRAVIAWKPTPEASRAVHDALVLLAPGAQLDVAVIEPWIGDRGHGEEPGADIAAHLAHHGFSVRVTVHENARGTVGNDLLLMAAETQADLIVAGAYGHSRAREWAFGGATRELLRRSHVPVLFSH
jgi:nucleotide-binding universal stress UspA family protein